MVAQKSEFATVPVTIMPFSPGTLSSNTLPIKPFHNKQELKTKLFLLTFSLTFGGCSRKLVSRGLCSNRENIEMGMCVFRILKRSKNVWYT